MAATMAIFRRLIAIFVLLLLKTQIVGSHNLCFRAKIRKLKSTPVNHTNTI